jgi:hypothetical protein
MGEYVVIPAHKSGAAFSKLRFSGICTAKWSLTTM